MTDPRAGTSIRTPFNILIGDWIGVGVLFLPNGEYFSHIASRVLLHEVQPGDEGYKEGTRRLRYDNYSAEGQQVFLKGQAPPALGDVHELFGQVSDAICRCNYTMLFEVEGKVATAIEKSSSIISAIGYMSTNDNYSFIIRDKLFVGGEEIPLTLHNNHYFASSNTRQVFGTISDPDGHTVMTTSFTYTSYTPPGE